MATAAVLSPTAHSFGLDIYPTLPTHISKGFQKARRARPQLQLSMEPIFSPASVQDNTTPRSERAKPKLQLDLSSVKPKQILGRSNSLRLDTVVATTPTSLNTFKNTFNSADDLLQSPDRAFGLATINTVNIDTPPDSPPSPLSEEDSIHHLSISQNLKRRRSADIPHRLVPEVKSILVNGPSEKRRRLEERRRSSCKSPVPVLLRRSSSEKSVSFKDPLTEEIENKEYTLRNIDIHSPLLSPPPEEESSDKETLGKQQPPPRKREVAGKLKADRSTDGEEKKSNPPKTPVAGRLKREREWVWTLGPLPNQTT